MSMKTRVSLGALVVVALLVPGIAYWAFHERSQPAPSAGLVGASPVASQASAPPAPPLAIPQASAPPSPPAPPSAPSSSPAIAQANQPAATPSPSPATPPNAPAAAGRGQVTAPSLATPAAPTATLPAEDQMSEADRRQVQEVLQRLKYYQGPIDGKFGQATRAAIRLFQDSISVKSTGYLTAAEATRLGGSAPR